MTTETFESVLVQLASLFGDVTAEFAALWDERSAKLVNAAADMVWECLADERYSQNPYLLQVQSRLDAFMASKQGPARSQRPGRRRVRRRGLGRLGTSAAVH